MLRLLACGFAALLLVSSAQAQQNFGITPSNTSTQTISASTSSSSITLDSKTGSTVVITNTSTTTTAYVTGSATATTTGFPIPAGYAVVFNFVPGTVISAITASSTATLLVAKGSGPTAIAGGGAGGGGGSVTQGTIPWLEAPASQSSTGTAWTSATALNATQILMAVGQGAPAVLVQLNQTTTISAGAVTIEGTYDNTNWVTVPVAQVLNPNTFAPLTNPYTLVASTNQPFLILTQGYQSVRVKLSTQITGSGTVTPQITLLPTNPTIGALLNPLAAGSAIIGKVGIDQTTMGTTNGVAPAGIAYETVAAGVTAQALGATGATGDYLSHCVLYPVSVSPGVVTVFDSTSSPTNNVITFAGGSSSLSNLAPISIPVGAVSLNGAWKVTTGTDVLVICYGKFT